MKDEYCEMSYEKCWGCPHSRIRYMTYKKDRKMGLRIECRISPLVLEVTDCPITEARK